MQPKNDQVSDAITRALADEQHGLTPELGERLIAAARRLRHTG